MTATTDTVSGVDDPTRPASSSDRRPRSMVLSAALGAVGIIVIVAGAVLGNTPLFVAGFIAGACSLGFALYWRSELIAAYHADDPRPPRQI